MKTNDKCVSVGRATGCLLSCFMALGAYADGYVTLTKSTSYTAGFAGAVWSEEVTDPSTRDYLVNNPKAVFYTTNGETVNAKSLTFGEVGGGAAKYYTCYSATFENNGLIFANGEAYLNRTSPTLAGQATFTSPATAPFRFYGTTQNDKRGFVFSGDVHSAETAGILVYANAHTDFYFTFSGDTSDYLGSIVVTSNYDTAGVPLGAEFRLSGSASNFGGSITVRDGAKFHPTITTSVKSLALESGATVLMDAGNTLTVGSLTIEEGATLSLNAGNTLTVNMALTVNGRAYKEGPGMLALGGVLRFRDSEGALTETPPAEAINRTFYVTGGRIKPLSAHSLDGLDVVFSNKTSKLDVGITVDIEPTDAELLAKGLCNAKSENPFAVQSDNANEKINIALECADPVEGKIYEFAVMTLTNTVADAVFDRLTFTRPEGFSHYKLNLERISDTEAGTKTLRATFKKCGFMLSIR